MFVYTICEVRRAAPAQIQSNAAWYIGEPGGERKLKIENWKCNWSDWWPGWNCFLFSPCASCLLYCWLKGSPIALSLHVSCPPPPEQEAAEAEAEAAAAAGTQMKAHCILHAFACHSSSAKNEYLYSQCSWVAVAAVVVVVTVLIVVSVVMLLS